MLEFGGSKKLGQQNDLFDPVQVKAFTKKMIKGLKGVENIYTQHTPLVKEHVEDLLRGRLRESQFPYLGTVQLRDRPQEVIVFTVGGVTYEESLCIYNINKSFPGVKVILGGSSVHNFRSFMDEVRAATTPSYAQTSSSSSSSSRLKNL